jgi:hypothetical protein
MADIGKEFFLARGGPGDYVATNAIRMPAPAHLLEQRRFARGHGGEFKEFLLGAVATGEAKPRVLPRAVFNAIQRFVSRYRRQKAGVDTAFLVQIDRIGGRWLGWSLERIVSVLEAAFGVRDDQLRIRCFHRMLHYGIRITAFDDAQAMNRWYWRFGIQPLSLQKAFRTRLPEGDDDEHSWFETAGWQRLPGEFVGRLKDDARALVFPSYGKQLREALYRDRWDALNPLLFLPEVTYHFIGATDHHHGPENHVWTEYRAKYKLLFYEGMFPA